MANTQQDDDILDIAANWIVRLRSPEASSRDHVEFSKWLNETPAHQQAFDEMLCTWETMALGAELPEETWNPKAQKQGLLGRWRLRLLSLKPGPANSSQWTAGLVTACLIVMLAVAFVIEQPTPVEPIAYSTAIGEARQIELSDGSIIQLNTQTHIEVVYSEEQRLVKLLKGEAYFAVEGNKSRPFIVDVGRATVTAVGTAFNIKRGKQEDWVAVTEGLVRVKQKKTPTTPFPESKFVQADQHLSLTGNGLSAAKDLDTEIHWLDRTLAFDNTPLNQALDELNRYLTEPVAFKHNDLSELRLSGTFRLDAPNATLQAIIASFDLQFDNNTITPCESHQD